MCAARFYVSNDDQAAARACQSDIDQIRVGRESELPARHRLIDDRREVQNVAFVALEPVRGSDCHWLDAVAPNLRRQQFPYQLCLCAVRRDDADG